MTDKTIEDFESEGFKIYDEGKKPSSTSGPKESGETKVLVLDTKEVLHAVNQANAIVKEGIENSNKQLAASIAKIVRAVDERPDGFTLNIHRDQRGFMTSIDVKIKRT